ncbi:MAG: F0F1 ATP synthase subunit delta [Candidatus Omnitrophota bacterium]
MLIVSLIILQLIIFGGLIFMLKRILTNNITSATQHIDSLNQDYTKKMDDLNKREEEAQGKVQEILGRSQEEADRLRTQIMKDTEAEKDRIIRQARTQGEEMIKQADRSRQSLISEMEERISKEAVNKACDLIHAVLPEEVKKSAHAQWVQDVVKSGFSKLDRLRIPEDVHEITVTSAFPLADGERKVLARALKDVLNRDVALKEDVDPKLVAGLVISIGSIVLDGSLRNKVKEQAQEGA